MRTVQTLLAVLLVLGFSGVAQAQTTGTSSAASSLYPGVEGLIFQSMTPEQQSYYNFTQVTSNLATQVLTVAFYNNAQKKYDNYEQLTPFELSILSRGPFPLTVGNQYVVPIGSFQSATTTIAGSTGTGATSQATTGTTTGTTTSSSSGTTTGSTTGTSTATTGSTTK